MRQVLGRNQILPDIPITIGRQPFVGGSQMPIENLPSGHLSGQNVTAYFASVFQFSPKEAATIMGVHTLGGAGLAESGYVGDWTSRSYAFDNDYYRAIIAPTSIDQSCPQGPITTLADPNSQCNGWEVREIRSDAGRKFQWRHSCNPDGSGCVRLMLHVDMGLFKDIDEFICTAADAKTRTHRCEVEGQVSPQWGCQVCTHCSQEC
jgi:hypothetical protein